jgi:hypothetical protein
MKRLLTLAFATATTFTLMSCASEPVVEHHYHYRSTPRTTTTKTTKSASVSGSSSSPEAFQAVTPPSSYSQ